MLGTLHSATAGAEGPPTAALAQALFEQARDDVRRGAFDAACPKFAESERIDPSNGTLLNLVLCEERLGKVATAWLHARELLDRLPDGDDRRPIAERKLAALSARVPRLTVRLAPTAASETHVSLDDVPLATTSLGIPVPVDPGTHRIVVTGADGVGRSAQVTVTEARDIDWVAEPPQTEPSRSVDRPASNPLPPPGRPAEKAQSSGVPRWVGWTGIGVGVAGLAAGALLGVLAFDRRATVNEVCPAKQCRDNSGLNTANEGQAFFVGAIAALGLSASGFGLGVYVLRQETSGTGAVPSSAAVPPISGTVLSYAGTF